EGGGQIYWYDGEISVTWASRHPRLDGPRYDGGLTESNSDWIANQEDAWTIPHVPQRRGSFLAVSYQSGALVFLQDYHFATCAVARRITLHSLHLMIASLLLPSLALSGIVGKWRSHARRKAGRSPICGYDLRATRDRCPECGAVPSQGGTAA